MASKEISRQEMLKRVARFKDLEPSEYAFLDSKIPGHERLIYNVIGSGVTEDASLKPAIAEASDFNVTYVKAEPGKGAALHSHPTVEVFTPLSGKWAIFWGDNGENEVILDAWDTISVPPGVLRGFRNAGHEDAHLMAILGGTDAGRVTWQPEVLEKAKQTGIRLDEHGNVVRG
jgi:quercetin dioxygenase-like cupin family protein